MYLAVAITVGAVVTGWRRFLIATPAAAVLTHLAITVLALDYRRSLGFDDTYGELMLGTAPSWLFAFMGLAGLAPSAARLINKKAHRKWARRSNERPDRTDCSDRFASWAAHCGMSVSGVPPRSPAVDSARSTISGAVPC